jgi:nicotinate phosphoribosyltransferase
MRIFASSSVDENLMARAAAARAPIDGYGIGTHLTTSADVPYLDCAYKLQEYAGQPRRKRSPGKSTWPGRKQVYRRFEASGQIAADAVTTEGDSQEGDPLLRAFMRKGRRTAPAESMVTLRSRASAALRTLPVQLRALERTEPEPLFQPTISQYLRDLAARADALAMTARDLDRGHTSSER